jgi:hypothetical protein
MEWFVSVLSGWRRWFLMRVLRQHLFARGGFRRMLLCLHRDLIAWFVSACAFLHFSLVQSVLAISLISLQRVSPPTGNGCSHHQSRLRGDWTMDSHWTRCRHMRNNTVFYLYAY